MRTAQHVVEFRNGSTSAAVRLSLDALPSLSAHVGGQGAIRKGAELAMVQEAMGWSSDRMARRYEGWVRQERAAASMPSLAPV